MAQRAGATSLILIRRDENRNKRAWGITPEQADYLYKKQDGKSIKWSWFEDNAIELIRLKNPVRWNLNKLFEEYIYAYIRYSILNGRLGVQEYVVNRARKDKSSLLRNAKIRLSNIHPGRLLMNLRGQNKLIK